MSVPPPDRNERLQRAAGQRDSERTRPTRQQTPARPRPRQRPQPGELRPTLVDNPFRDATPLDVPVGIDVALAAVLLALAVGFLIVRDPFPATARLLLDAPTRVSVVAALLASGGLAWLARRAWGSWATSALPVCALWGSVLLTMREPRWVVLLIAALLAGGVLISAQLLRDALRLSNGTRTTIQAGSVALTLLVGFLVLTLLDLRRPPGWMLAIAVAAIVGFLSLQHADEELAVETVHLRAISAALGTAGVAWALTWWPPTSWAPGGILTVLLAAAIVLLGGVPNLRPEQTATQRGLAAVLLLTVVAGAVLGA